MVIVLLTKIYMIQVKEVYVKDNKNLFKINFNQY